MNVLANSRISGLQRNGGAPNFGTVATPGYTGSPSAGALLTLDGIDRATLTEFELSNHHYALLLLKNAPHVEAATFIDKFHLHDAYIGIKAETSGEYVSFGQGTVRRCTIGVHITSGNNKLLGTNITRNKYGLYVGPGTNEAHGVIDGVTLNHNETNFMFDSIAIGQVVNGGCIFGGFSGGNGAGIIQSSKGVMFNGTHIGSSDITIDATSEVAFRNVLWQGNVNITVAAGGVLDAKNCFKVAGATLTLNGVSWSGNN